MPLSPPIAIRPARTQDLDTLVAFNLAMALETEGLALDRRRVRQGVEAVLTSPPRGFYVVAEAQIDPQPRMVGQLMVTYEWSDWRNGTFWWIQSVYVEPEWRRRGILRSMHEHLLAEARARPDVCGLRLYVEAGNATAQAAYERVGLAETSYRVFEQDFVLAEQRSASKAGMGKARKR